MVTDPFAAGFPVGAPFVDQSGQLTPIWQTWLQQLWRRTGAGVGTSTGDLSAALVSETAAREAGDTSLTSAISTESAARSTAEASMLAQLRSERSARIANDAALGLALGSVTAFAAADLSGLPHTDLGGGRPWLDGIHIAVGSLGVGLEDGTGGWELESMGGRWTYG